MQDVKTFRKMLRQEIGYVADALRKLEHQSAHLRGKRRREMRLRLSLLKRVRHHLMQRVLSLRVADSGEGRKGLCPQMARRLHARLHRLRDDCRMMQAEMT
jgi:hypothetical protein